MAPTLRVPRYHLTRAELQRVEEEGKDAWADILEERKPDGYTYFPEGTETPYGFTYEQPYNEYTKK